MNVKLQVIGVNQIWEQLCSHAGEGDGFIRTSQVEQAGISCLMLKKYMDMGKLDRVRKGIYTLSDYLPDEYVLL